MPRLAPHIVLGLLLGAFVAYAITLAASRPDDVFIYYRYATNLAGGHGFSLNPPERVEGVTSLLWTAALSALVAVSPSLEVSAPLLSLLVGCLVLWRVAKISATLSGRKDLQLADLIPCLLTAASCSFAYWSYSGMETVAAPLVLLLSIELYLRDSLKHIAASAMVLGIGTTIRPEMLAVAPAFIIHALLEKRSLRQRLIVWTAIFSLVTLSIFCARYGYFGYWLPNTYYAKSGGELSYTLLLGVSYYLTFLASLLPVTPLAALNVGLATVLVTLLLYHAFRVRNLTLFTLIFAALSAAAIFDGGDWMPASRLLVTSIPILAIIVGIMAMRCSDSRPYIPKAFLLLAILQIAYGLVLRFHHQGELHLNNRKAPPAAPFIAHLLMHAQPSDAVALMDIGEIGYRTKLHVIDISGLTEPFIAHSSGGFLCKQYSPSWLLEQKPRWIALRKKYFIDSRILAAEEFQQRYTPVLEIAHPAEMTLYERLP
jgi:hypothetical protein